MSSKWLYSSSFKMVNFGDKFRILIAFAAGSLFMLIYDSRNTRSNVALKDGLRSVDYLDNSHPPVNTTPPRGPYLDRRDHFQDLKQDAHLHVGDDTTTADFLYHNVRVLCWITTYPQNLWTRGLAVNATWGKRCNLLLFMSDEEDKQFPAIGLDIMTGRKFLANKTMAAFDYIYQHHLHDADWFLKADDDTYVIVENLRYLLSQYSPRNPVFLGHHFVRPSDKVDYFSGGGGYVLSKEALRRYGTRPRGACVYDIKPEDVAMGHCMADLGVPPKDTWDALGRSRFHCFYPAIFIKGKYPDWFPQYDVKHDKRVKGVESMSDYSVSFHYITAENMYVFEFLLYHLRPYGINNAPQKLNPKQ